MQESFFFLLAASATVFHSHSYIIKNSADKTCGIFYIHLYRFSGYLLKNFKPLKIRLYRLFMCCTSKFSTFHRNFRKHKHKEIPWKHWTFKGFSNLFHCVIVDLLQCICFISVWKCVCFTTFFSFAVVWQIILFILFSIAQQCSAFLNSWNRKTG